jgi:integrase
MSANGKVKPNVVIVGGVEAVFAVGNYELRSYEGTKTKWRRVEGNATDALAALKSAQKRANAVAVADDAELTINTDPKRLALRPAAQKFVTAAADRGSMEAAEIYERTLDEFLAGCSKLYADELTHDDVLKFHGQLRKRGMAERTVHNRHMALRSYLLTLGFTVERVKEVAGRRAPKFERTLPEIYSPDQLKKFFASLQTDYDKLLFDLLLTTGLREREAMHLEWVDFNFAHSTLTVKSKPRYDHKIKDAEERELPITKELIKRLKSYRKTHTNSLLVFGSRCGAVDVPDGHLLRRLKSLARDAGLNCGECSTCVSSDRAECERWFLHKFRATFCTTLLRAGMDLRTAQRLMGHSDIESTMRYLRPAETVEIQTRVNTIKWR